MISAVCSLLFVGLHLCLLNDVLRCVLRIRVTNRNAVRKCTLLTISYNLRRFERGHAKQNQQEQHISESHNQENELKNNKTIKITPTNDWTIKITTLMVAINTANKSEHETFSFIKFIRVSTTDRILDMPYANALRFLVVRMCPVWRSRFSDKRFSFVV